MHDLWIMSRVLNHCIVPQPLLIDESSSIVVFSGYQGMEYSPLEATVLGLIRVVTQNGFFIQVSTLFGRQAYLGLFYKYNILR